MRSIDKRDVALFLDFDGTLVDFAETPEGVKVSEELRDLLKQLFSAFDGAMALVSGRSIESLDLLTQLPQFPLAGSHGAEWRWPDGSCDNLSLDTPEFFQALAQVTEFSHKHELLLEDKKHSFALHFRKQPDLQQLIDRFLAEKIEPYSSLRVIYGNCVREIQPLGVDKGRAVARFMQRSPYRTRRPCYLGDDTTDEDAFAWVNNQQGISVKVGSGASCATERLETVADTLAFLKSLLRS